jgi:hypothetical protein
MKGLKIRWGSGFPAAICSVGLSANRGWKAAPAIKPTPKVLKLKSMRLGGNDKGEYKNFQTFKITGFGWFSPY